nr:MAG TPA: resistance protein [Caudoviricetes sp.]
MSTMYELTADYLEVLDLANDPDIPPEVVADTLEGIGGEIEIKAENTAKILKELEASVAASKAEEKRLVERRKQLETNVQKIKERLFDMMKTTGKVKFKTNLFSFSIQKNGGKLPVVLDVKDTSELPDDLVKITETADLEAIRELLDAGDTRFAHYGERGESLRIK